QPQQPALGLPAMTVEARCAESLAVEDLAIHPQLAAAAIEPGAADPAGLGELMQRVEVLEEHLELLAVVERRTQPLDREARPAAELFIVQLAKRDPAPALGREPLGQRLSHELDRLLIRARHGNTGCS